MTPPDWLTRRGGELKLASDGKTWYVVFSQQPQYAVTTVPAAGKYNCAIRQTINGRRLDSAGTYATPGEALQGGLEDLRKALGW